MWDTLVIFQLSSVLEANSQQLLSLKVILDTFVDSTCLKVNYAKSSMYPINIIHEMLHHLSATFSL
jgi:hypothetical protein